MNAFITPRQNVDRYARPNDESRVLGQEMEDQPGEEPGKIRGGRTQQEGDQPRLRGTPILAEHAFDFKADCVPRRGCLQHSLDDGRIAGIGCSATPRSTILLASRAVAPAARARWATQARPSIARRPLSTWRMTPGLSAPSCFGLLIQRFVAALFASRQLTFPLNSPAGSSVLARR